MPETTNNQNQEEKWLRQKAEIENESIPPAEPISQIEPTEEDLALAGAAELEAASLAMTIDFENTKPNSVLVIKIPADNPMYHARIHAAIIQGILNPRIEILKEKKLGVLFMTTEDEIELLSEEDMNKAGWVKKDKSSIISPF